MHLLGLALAIGLGAWAEVLLLVVLMEKRVGFDLRPLARHALAFAAGACVASAAALVVARFIERSTGGASSLVTQFGELAASGLVGLVAYMAWARVFRLPELADALELARTLTGRRKPAPPEPPARD
jgi:peptidoglycan biosynthesis protein MviN/MurJ (putative lipid II flippase)